MSDAAITVIVTGLVNVAGLLIGFATLWLKIRTGTIKAEEAVTKAQEVERKIDDNTAITKTAGSVAMVAADKANEAAVKADTAVKMAEQTSAEKISLLHKIEKQTNGTVEVFHDLMRSLTERVAKLEEYNRDSAHRLLDAINAMHLKVAEVAALQMRSIPKEPSP